MAEPTGFIVFTPNPPGDAFPKPRPVEPTDLKAFDKYIDKLVKKQLEKT
jgi:hypothetical protein